MFIGVVCLACTMHTSFAQTETTFSPTVKMKALVHARFESSLTDSVDVQNTFLAEPLQNNFRLRRLEIRADMKLNENWSGVVRLQLPQLKSSAVGGNISAGNVIELAYAEYKTNDKLQVRFGQFKIPYELDELISHEDLRMIDRGTTSALLVKNNQASYQAGIMLFGTFLKEKTPLTYYFAAVNGNSRSANYDDNNQKNLVERIEFSPVKSFRIGINTQQTFLNDTTHTVSYGADVQYIRNISAKTQLILEGQYITGSNFTEYTADVSDTTSTVIPDITDYSLGGFLGQALVRFDIEKNWCKTFEIGSKYEKTDPLVDFEGDAFSTITGNIGFIFLPDNMARLQFNFIHTDWESVLPGSETINSANMFVAQLQMKI